MHINAKLGEFLESKLYLIVLIWLGKREHEKADDLEDGTDNYEVIAAYMRMDYYQPH